MERAWCVEHLTMQPCARCAAATPRDVVSVLKGQVDDLGAEVMALRRQVSEQLHLLQHLQIDYARLAAHVRPDEDLLP